MKIKFLPLIFISAFGLAACGSTNSPNGAPTKASSLGGVHVGNPIDGQASGGTQTYSSPNGFEIPVQSGQSLRLTSKTEITIQSDNGSELFIRVIDAEKGPRSVEDFQAFLDSLTNPNQFDVVEVSLHERCAVRHLVEGSNHIDERIVLTPNRKILWMRIRGTEKAKSAFQSNLDHLSYDLTAPILDQPELEYDLAEKKLYFRGRISKNHALHDVRVQMWLEDMEAPLTSVNRMIVTQLILTSSKEGKVSAKTKEGSSSVDLINSKYQVNHLIIWDPLGNRRIFMAPPFGRFYQVSVIPISRSEDEKNKIEATKLPLINLNLKH